MLLLLCPAHMQAGETEDALKSIKSRLPFISTGEFYFRREPRDYTQGNQVTAAWKILTELQAQQLVTADLLQLTAHADPDVRALTLLALLTKETPELVPACLKLVTDQAAVLPREERPSGMSGERLDQPITYPQTVGDVARVILYRLGWLGNDPDTEAWWAPRKDNADWLAWYKLRYERAVKGYGFLQDTERPDLRRFMDSLEVLPRATRAWVLLYLVDDVMLPDYWQDWFAKEAEMIAAARELGPEALLEFMRSGKRGGLRLPELDKPENGRRFIIKYAAQLFTPAHAEELLKLKLYTAAADADPSLVRRAVDAATKDLVANYQNFDRALVMAALATLGDVADRDRAVKWFYDEPNVGGAQTAFIHDLEFRKPKEWRDIARRLVEHPSFERLRSLDVMYLSILVDIMEGNGPPPPARDDAAYNRKRLREKFNVK
ncbi:hypothetical protein G5S37_31010 [Roseimicrobium sp. ORNL1]|nr:hypothetical protein G5S37_31010 [Roseimicrobium sp. ORNL1]